MFVVPKEVREIISTLNAKGYEAYIVGGCVRDLIMGLPPKDWDITTQANPDEIQAHFPDCFYENNFGTVGIKTGSEDPLLQIVEVTPYRLESGYSNNRHPDTVSFTLSLEEDLARRDFTMNAIAYNPVTGSIIDLHDGQKDIAHNTIRTVGTPAQRFSEDALRILRALRFSAQLGFTIEAHTLTALHEHRARLESISRERVRDEFLKLLNTPRPLETLYMAQKLELLQYIIPELLEGVGCMQNQAHSYDVFEHLLRTMQHAADEKWSIELRIAGLLHDIGKPRTRAFSKEKGDWTFYGHEVVGAKMTRKILKDLRLSTEMSEKIIKLIRWHMFFSDPDQITLSAVRRMIRNVGQENIWDLLNLRVCDRIGTGRPKAHPFRLRKYISMVEEALRDPITVGMLKVDGATLINEFGIAPSPRIGWVLHALLEEVLENPTLNTEEYLRERITELLTLPEAELKILGEAGKDAQEDANDAEVKKLRKKHKVF